jgi:hypothetical protein
VANGSNEVLQTLSAHLRRPGPHGRHLRADLPAARAHRPAHRGHGGRGSGPPTSRSTSTRCGGSSPSRRRPSPSCARPTTRPAWSSRGHRARGARPGAGGLLVVDEAYGQFAPWSALELVDDDTPLVVTRTFSKTWSMAGGPARLPDRPDLGGRRARQGGAAVPPRRGEADRRHVSRSTFVDEMERGCPLSSRSAAGCSRAASCRSTCGRRAPTSSCSGPAPRRRRRVAGLRRPQRARAQLLGWPAARRLPARHHRHPDENDRFLAALQILRTTLA